MLRLFVGGATPYADNRGVTAIISGLLQILRKTEDRSFKVTIWHSYPESLQRYVQDVPTTHSLTSPSNKNLYIRMFHYKLPNNSFLAYLFFVIKLLISIIAIISVRILRFLHIKYVPRIEGVPDIISADMIIETNFGDTFTDKYYGKNLWYSNVLRLTLEILTGKPVYLFPQSIGPFNSTMGKALALVLLKKTKVVMVREQFSYQYLRHIGISPDKVKVTLDLSFWTPIISAEEAIKILDDECANKESQRTRKIVGLLLNDYISKKFGVSLQTISKTIDLLIDDLGVYVVFISHGTSVTNSIVDSRNISFKIRELMKNKEHSVVLAREYTVEELWGVIGQCDLIISALTHPILSALRQDIPVLAVGYSHKTLGVMQFFQMEKYLINYSDFKQNTILEKTSDLLKNSVAIKQNLKKRHPLTKVYMASFQAQLTNLWAENDQKY